MKSSKEGNQEHKPDVINYHSAGFADQMAACLMNFGGAELMRSDAWSHRG